MNFKVLSMLNICMIACINLKTKGMIGVKKKIYAQCTHMSNNNVTASLLCMDGADIILINFYNGLETEKKILSINTPVGGEFFFRKVVELIQQQKIKTDYWYIRYCVLTDDSLAILAKVAAENADVYFEIPTFPYSGELTKEQLETDADNQRLISPYVTGVFSPSCVEGDIFLGKKIKKTGNGVQLYNLSYQFENKDIQTDFNIVGVAYLSFWHGYDRVIKSLNDFKRRLPNVRCRYYIVGEGPEKDKLVKLAEELSVRDMIYFCGSVDGEELIKIYNSAHCGVASLGLHRIQDKGVKIEPLKVREFMAMGLPFVLSYQDSVDFYSLPGVYLVNDDDLSIDLVDIFNKCKCFYSSNSSRILRNFAKEHFDWGEIMKKQVDSIIRRTI
ncbi:glycosyltransferase [Aeromonas enteropelogenes]|uniref:glycosyltransferase n=1 Tax=Aeromonas enteropelogenes TaxID=29489 RepID=UPI001F40DFB5|nr:glycosyltransferase [Aeromonas enteropelogenes]